MSKTATVRARIEPDLKDKVEHVFRQLGLNATQAITLFYSASAFHYSISGFCCAKVHGASGGSCVPFFCWASWIPWQADAAKN